MFRRPDPSPAIGPSVVAGPHDSCVRCGRATPLGVALCEHDNPARIKGPSATQVHGTIVFGLIGGFILFGLLAALSTAGVGPFEAQISGQATRSDGSVQVQLRVTNEGSRSSAASCRVSRGGVTGAGDAVFFSQPIPPGETREFGVVLGASAGSPRGGAEAIAVRCN